MEADDDILDDIVRMTRRDSRWWRTPAKFVTSDQDMSTFLYGFALANRTVDAQAVVRPDEFIAAKRDLCMVIAHGMGHHHSQVTNVRGIPLLFLARICVVV